MTNEKEAGAEAVSPPEETVDTLRQKLTEYQSQIETITGERDTAREEAKTHQRNVSKKDASQKKELESWKTGIEGKLNLTNTMLAEYLDSQTGNLEEPPARRTEYSARVKEFDKKQPEVDPATYRKMMTAEVMAEQAGLDIETAPELKQVRLLFSSGDSSEGLGELKRVIAEMNKPPEVKETDEEKTARIEKAILEKHGLLTPEGGMPAGGGDRHFTVEQIEEMSGEEYARNQEAINAAYRAGRVKTK